jgi:hypothetical protein
LGGGSVHGFVCVQKHPEDLALAFLPCLPLRFMITLMPPEEEERIILYVMTVSPTPKNRKIPPYHTIPYHTTILHTPFFRRHVTHIYKTVVLYICVVLRTPVRGLSLCRTRDCEAFVF